MGEVYLARDAKLDREVAVKVLPKDFASDETRLRRIEQEPRTLAALNHPTNTARSRSCVRPPRLDSRQGRLCLWRVKSELSMSGCKRILANLEGRSVDRLLLMLTMQFACDLTGAKYRDYEPIAACRVERPIAEAADWRGINRLMLDF